MIILASTSSPRHVKACDCILRVDRLKSGRAVRRSVLQTYRPAQTADEFGDERVREYFRDGFCALCDNRTEKELISPDKIEEISIEVERKNLAPAEILMLEADFYNKERPVNVTPRRKGANV